MGHLENKKCYLAGAIEFGEKTDWRNYPKRILVEKFGIHVFDPFADPKQQWSSAIQMAKNKKDYKEVANITKKFVRKDLGIIDRSDFIVAYLPHKIPTAGTCHEIINSNNSKKPTLLVSDSGDIAFIPTWYFGFISINFMFPNWDALFTYLQEVDEGKHKNNDRWSFVYGDI